MAKAVKSTPDYRNWVSKRIIYLPAVLGLALSVFAFLFWMLAIPAILFFVAAAYFGYAR
jgi:hypothetical protein